MNSQMAVLTPGAVNVNVFNILCTYYFDRIVETVDSVFIQSTNLYAVENRGIYAVSHW